MAAPFLDSYLPYLLQRADHLLSERFHEALRQRGVQTSAWRVLAVLREAGPLTIGALTRHTLLPQPTTTHTVDRLEQAGFVTRRASPDDGRQRIVALTRSGAREANRLVRSAESELAATLDEAGVDVPVEFVDQLRKFMVVLDRSIHMD